MFHISKINSYPAMNDAMQVNGSIYFARLQGYVIFKRTCITKNKCLFGILQVCLLPFDSFHRFSSIYHQRTVHHIGPTARECPDTGRHLQNNGSIIMTQPRPEGFSTRSNPNQAVRPQKKTLEIWDLKRNGIVL